MDPQLSQPAGVSLAQYETWVMNEFGPDAASVLAAYPASNFPRLRDAMARLVGDGQFVSEARRLARLIERTGTPTFLYSYEYEIDALSLDRVIHGVESSIIFGNNYVPRFPELRPQRRGQLCSTRRWLGTGLVSRLRGTRTATMTAWCIGLPSNTRQEMGEDLTST